MANAKTKPRRPRAFTCGLHPDASLDDDLAFLVDVQTTAGAVTLMCGVPPWLRHGLDTTPAEDLFTVWPPDMPRERWLPRAWSCRQAPVQDAGIRYHAKKYWLLMREELLKLQT